MNYAPPTNDEIDELIDIISLAPEVPELTDRQQLIITRALEDYKIG